MTAARQTVSFDLGGRSYEVVADFGVMDRIESDRNSPSLITMAEAMERGDVRTPWLARIIHSAIAEAGYGDTYRQVGQACMDNMEEAGAAVSVIVSAMFDVGEAGERQAGKEKTAVSKGKGKGKSKS